MDETQIVEKLKANVTSPPDTILTPAIPEINTDNGQATIAPAYSLDELEQFKLHQFFGEIYSPVNVINQKQIQFIYNAVRGMVDEPEYSHILAKISDIERVIGTANSEQRLYKLYQYLKLDKVRSNIDKEMGALIQ